MYLVMCLLAATRHAEKTGHGQVVDCAMVDGASSLMGMCWDMRNAGQWDDVREANMLDGGAPYYHVYKTSDGGFMAVGAIEPQFFRLLIQITGLPESYLPIQNDRSQWPRLHADLAKAFASRTRAEWTAAFDGTDACVTPVLPMAEVADYPHMAARTTISPAFDVPQPAPAPRFSATPGAIRNAEAITAEAAIAAWTAVR
jgi:alpha-methylacyl-CoA racemase